MRPTDDIVMDGAMMLMHRIAMLPFRLLLRAQYFEILFGAQSSNRLAAFLPAF
jgi:hypothetical protein